MARHELDDERLMILPMRLETIVITGGPVHQRSVVSQTNVNEQVGGECIKSGCDQTHSGVKIVRVDQTLASETSLGDVIDDHA